MSNLSGEDDSAGLGNPTATELLALPRWAMVAFAVRCAMRARPLLTMFWPDAEVGDIDNAINVARSAVHTDDYDLKDRAYHARDAVTRYGERFACFCSDPDPRSAEFGYAVVASMWVVLAANCAVWASVGMSRRDEAAEEAAAAAWAGAADAMVGGREVMHRAARTDYQRLVQLIHSEGWTDKTSVDTALLGPLWPEGEPEWKGRVGC